MSHKVCNFGRSLLRPSSFLEFLLSTLPLKFMRCLRQIKAGMVGDSGKVILAGLLEISYGAEGPMLDLNIIFETIGHVCPLIESDVW